MKRVLQIAVIAALTVFFLWLFLRNANLSEVGAILRRSSFGWVLVGFAVNIIALVSRTVRWRTLLDPEDPPPFYATFFANAVGYMSSIVLPIRASDLARPVLLSRRTSHRFSGALGTILCERVLDLTSILTMFVFFAALRWNEFSHDPATAAWFYIVRAGAIASAVILTVLWSFLIGLRFSRDTIRRLHEALGRLLPKRIRPSWMHFFDTFAETLRISKYPGALAKVLFCTVLTWTCLTAQFWFATKAVHQPLPYDSSFFVTGVTTVGLAIPTPGGIGGFHKACQLVLTRFYAFSVESSVAVAVLFHVIGTLPVLTIGLFLFAKEGVSLKQLRGTDEEETANRQPPTANQP
ncbi:MAG TPA: lysylphosphatidylglycerol synthase transmembrane domain-containing protein [Thermoanaerobaculia bacterium]|nr:lysylphosphatidylglycerol synthase transmembrane domain-containing protein [Thermoanaerobaculia bacterium]